MHHGHSHSHGHGHDHDGPCDHDHNHGHSSMSGLEMSHGHFETGETTTESDPNTPGKTYSADDFMNVVRFGGKVHIGHLITKNTNLVELLDLQGNTCMHWAAKRGDVEILQYLVEQGAKLDTPATGEANLLPIHWAAAEGKVDALAFFLNQGQSINVQDSNGCTPVVIAVQFNQIEAFIFLAKHNADLTLVDHNGDHCLHWAAYKGYEEMSELVLYFIPQELNKIDTFGQTALHLGAIRGHADVVDILLRKHHADYMVRDKGGLTALDQAMKKANPKAEWVIRKNTASSYFDLIKKIIQGGRYKAKYIPNFIICGATDKEVGVYMWRLTCYSNFFATIMSFYFAMSSVLGDLYYLHIANTIVQVVWWLFFLSCLWRDPGIVRDQEDGRTSEDFFASSSNDKKLALYKVDSRNDDSSQRLTSHDHQGQHGNAKHGSYEHGLNIIGRVISGVGQPPSLCHTCRVHRPLRSKHCRVTGRCVHKFDHFCPYVYNTVGRDNYKFFVGLLFTHPFAFTGFMINSIYFYYRAPITTWFFCFLMYSILMCLMVLALGQYHLTLLISNMSTNEDINKTRYDYLRDERGRFSNPFDKGSAWKNIMDGLFPSSKSYFTREEVLRDL